jgi:glycosyltransferase involved in cell wall biosynthesis
MRQSRRVFVHVPEPTSGAALYVAQLVEALASVEPCVALFCPDNFVYKKEVAAAGAGVIELGGRGISHAGLLARVYRNLRFFAVAASRQWKATSRGDIIHFQFPPHFPLGLIPFLLARTRGCRIVFTVHDPLPHRWLYPPRLRFLEVGMRRYACNLSEVLVVHNKAGREILIRQFGQTPEKIEVIPHGPMNIGKRLPAKAPDAAELRLLLFGSIRENKGIHLAIEAVRRVNASSGLRVRLTIAGQEENSADRLYWHTCLESIAQAPEMFEVIHRYIGESEVPELVERHHGLLLPYTGFVSESGVAALALTHARPILGTRAGGLGELMENSGAGVVIPAATVDGIVAAVENALKAGKDELAVMGQRGAEFINRERGWGAIGRKTAAIYDRLSKDEASTRISSRAPLNAAKDIETTGPSARERP